MDSCTSAETQPSGAIKRNLLCESRSSTTCAFHDKEKASWKGMWFYTLSLIRTGLGESKPPYLTLACLSLLRAVLRSWVTVKSRDYNHRWWLGRSPHLLHLTAISNISLHCICLVLPLTRTLELLQVRCMACITSTVANPMAKKKKKKKKKERF